MIIYCQNLNESLSDGSGTPNKVYSICMTDMTEKKKKLECEKAKLKV